MHYLYGKIALIGCDKGARSAELAKREIDPEWACPTKTGSPLGVQRSQRKGAGDVLECLEESKKLCGELPALAHPLLQNSRQSLGAESNPQPIAYRKMELLSYNHKDRNFPNNPQAWRRTSHLKINDSPSQTWNSSPECTLTALGALQCSRLPTI